MLKINVSLHCFKVKEHNNISCGGYYYNKMLLLKKYIDSTFDPS